MVFDDGFRLSAIKKEGMHHVEESKGDVINSPGFFLFEADLGSPIAFPKL